jgi:hypothetical protein
VVPDLNSCFWIVRFEIDRKVPHQRRNSVCVDCFDIWRGFVDQHCSWVIDLLTPLSRAPPVFRRIALHQEVRHSSESRVSVSGISDDTKIQPLSLWKPSACPRADRPIVLSPWNAGGAVAPANLGFPEISRHIVAVICRLHCRGSNDPEAEFELDNNTTHLVQSLLSIAYTTAS